MVETTLPHAALQTALYTRLTTHAATSGYTFYAASAVPLNAAFPYGTLHVVGANPDQSKSTASWEVLAVVKWHTRSAAGVGGDAEAHEGASDIVQALTSSPVALGSGHTLIVARAPSVVSQDETAEGYAYRHRVIRLPYRTQYTG
jgi:hypothetical protein